MKAHPKIYLFAVMLSFISIPPGCNEIGFHFKNDAVTVVNPDKTRQKEKMNAETFVMAKKNGAWIDLSSQEWATFLEEKGDGKLLAPAQLMEQLDSNNLSFKMNPKLEHLVWEDDVMRLMDRVNSTTRLQFNMQNAHGVLFTGNKSEIEVALFGAQTCKDAHDVWAKMMGGCPASNGLSKLQLNFCNGQLWGTCLDENDGGIVVILIDPAVLDPVARFNVNPNPMDAFLNSNDASGSNFGFQHIPPAQSSALGYLANLDASGEAANVPDGASELPCGTQLETDLRTLLVRKNVRSMVECDGILKVQSDDGKPDLAIDIRICDLRIVHDENTKEMRILCNSKCLIKLQEFREE